MLHKRIEILLLGTLVLFFCATLGGTARGEEAVVKSKVLLKASGRKISAELFEQSDTQKRRVILVLHGAGGTFLDGPEMQRVARALAADGNAVYVLHYFERTGTVVAFDSTMQQHFAEWLETVRASIIAVQETRRDSAPVGLFGYSLGAFLALAVASDNPRVDAVVELAGGVWNSKFERIHRMPAVLMLHGKRDTRVPFARYAEPLVPILRQRASKLEARFFPEEGHGFTSASMATVRAEAANFFRRYLHSRSTAGRFHPKSNDPVN